MYSIFLCMAIGMIVGLIVAPHGLAKLSGALFCGGSGFVLGVIVGHIVCEVTPLRDIVYGASTMVSMRSTDGVTGTFVWGTGGIHGETSYNFMIVQQDGSITPRSVPADSRVAIIEDESLHGVGYWRLTQRELDPNSLLYNWGIGHHHYIENVRQEFRVPVGTVVQTFRVQ